MLNDNSNNNTTDYGRVTLFDMDSRSLFRHDLPSEGQKIIILFVFEYMNQNWGGSLHSRRDACNIVHAECIKST